MTERVDCTFQIRVQLTLRAERNAASPAWHPSVASLWPTRWPVDTRDSSLLLAVLLDPSIRQTPPSVHPTGTHQHVSNQVKMVPT